MALPIYADEDGAGSVQAMLKAPGMTVAALLARHFQETRTACPI